MNHITFSLSENKTKITLFTRSECLTGHLGELIDENFDMRAIITKLDPRDVEMVMLAHRLGAPAHYAGSGGLILGMYGDEQHLEALRQACATLGCRIIKPIVSASS